MNATACKLRRGDLVEIKSADEILQTLDEHGTVDGLPFMPEMIAFCRQRFRVSLRVVKTCYYGKTSGMRKFTAEDVVLLDSVRCSGSDHGGCQKSCLIFWRESWLRRVEEGKEGSASVEGRERLQAKLKTTTAPKKYFCQSSEILRATVELSRWDRLGKCYEDVRLGNCSAIEMVRRIAVWTYWKGRRMLFGPYGRGKATSTPSQSLHLRPGDRVEVRAMKSIRETLDERAHNRGLFFTPSMKRLCGQQRQVEGRIEKIIVDGTGEMRELSNTVYLDNEFCGCSCVAFGGCPRGEFSYWREIWLRRLNDNNQ